LIYRSGVYALNFNTFFSLKGLIYHQAKFFGLKTDLAYIFSNYYSEKLLIGSVFALAFFSIVGLLKKSNYITNFLLWFLVLNFQNFLYPTLTAGDYLLNQLLFFNILFSFRLSRFGIWNEIKTALHNSGLLAIKLQICLAYFLAAWFKLTDEDWMNGTSVYDIFQVSEYSNHFFKSLPTQLCVFLTYATIIYQLLFPMLIWFRRFKIYFFSFGIIQHLLIAFGMGLFSFGVIMAICYILFLKYDN